MPAFLKSFFKHLAYTLFFLSALIFFIYLTLPLETLQAYLVRKVSDEYAADLEISELAVTGPSSFAVRGVTYRPRPSAEEMSKIRAARKARKEWLERKKAKEQEAEARKEESKAPKEKGKKGKKGKKSKKGKKGKKEEEKRASKEQEKLKEEQAPPIPELPQALSLEVLSARINPLDLMEGLVRGELSAEVLQGELQFNFEHNKEHLLLQGSWSKLDLRQIEILKEFIKVPLGGNFAGMMDLEFPFNDKGKLRYASITGEISLNISETLAGPGSFKSPRMGEFELPKAELGELRGKVKFEKRKANIEEFSFNGKDIEGELTGFVLLNSKLKRWAPRLHMRFRFAENFLKEHSLGAALRVAFSKNAMDEDGFVGLLFKGVSFKKAKSKPRKLSPYKKQQRSAKKIKRSKKSAHKVRKKSTKKRGLSKASKRRMEKQKRAKAHRKAAKANKRKGHTSLSKKRGEKEGEGAEEEEEPEEVEETQEGEEAEEAEEAEESEEPEEGEGDEEEEGDEEGEEPEEGEGDEEEKE